MNKHGNHEQLHGYEVGYARPPAHNRFRPGQPGNPRGRPRKPQYLKRPNGSRLKSLFAWLWSRS